MREQSVDVQEVRRPVLRSPVVAVQGYRLPCPEGLCASGQHGSVLHGSLLDRGEWLKDTYLAGGTFSWRDWIEVACDLRMPGDSKARSVDVECVAEGGRVLLGGVEVVRGRALE